MKERGIIVKKS